MARLLTRSMRFIGTCCCRRYVVIQVSVVDTFRQKLQSGGVRELVRVCPFEIHCIFQVRYSTKGYVFRVAHVGATTVLMKSISTWVYAMLYPGLNTKH